MSDFPTAEALAVPCFAGSVEDAADLVVTRALSGEGGFAVLCNVHVLVTAQRNTRLRDALEEAWAVFPDGAPIAWLLRRSGERHANRVAGPDLMPATIEHGLAHGLRHFLLGSTPEVLGGLECRLRKRFPVIEIAGTSAPFGDDAALDAVVTEIREARPHLVWCALGAPKQELWMRRNAAALAPALALGVGAAFDFHAGTKARAPRWLQRLGLEWLFRLAVESRRLGRRYLTTNAAFVTSVAYDVCRHGRQVRVSARSAERYR
jgi:N-acetylglucosaminyldiphosphoundecaprenol N-acetyl-beta-D-mannosaminyltransferase